MNSDWQAVIIECAIFAAWVVFCAVASVLNRSRA